MLSKQSSPSVSVSSFLDRLEINLGCRPETDLENADPDNQAEHCVQWIRKTISVVPP